MREGTTIGRKISANFGTAGARMVENYKKNESLFEISQVW